LSINYLSGAINYAFSQFNNLFLVITLILNFIHVVTSNISLIYSKKKVIAIINALGCISQKLNDYKIMRAIAAKFKTIKKILFWEFFLILAVSLAVSFAFGLILTILFSYNLLSTQPVQIPIIMILTIFFILTSSNYMQIKIIKTKFKNKNLVRLL
jgi:predicted lysophospholipase L1 biosynthesis ABC-type transport system permease subunit